MLRTTCSRQRRLSKIQQTTTIISTPHRDDISSIIYLYSIHAALTSPILLDVNIRHATRQHHAIAAAQSTSLVVMHVARPVLLFIVIGMVLCCPISLKERVRTEIPHEVMHGANDTNLGQFLSISCVFCFEKLAARSVQKYFPTKKEKRNSTKHCLHLFRRAATFWV